MSDSRSLSIGYVMFSALFMCVVQAESRCQVAMGGAEFSVQALYVEPGRQDQELHPCVSFELTAAIQGLPHIRERRVAQLFTYNLNIWRSEGCAIAFLASPYNVANQEFHPASLVPAVTRLLHM